MAGEDHRRRCKEVVEAVASWMEAEAEACQEVRQQGVVLLEVAEVVVVLPS